VPHGSRNLALIRLSLLQYNRCQFAHNILKCCVPSSLSVLPCRIYKASCHKLSIVSTIIVQRRQECPVEAKQKAAQRAFVRVLFVFYELLSHISSRDTDWSSFAELKEQFGSADVLGKCVVFNIGSNKWRLIAKLDDSERMVFIKAVLTHKEYDCGQWKEDCGCIGRATAGVSAMMEQGQQKPKKRAEKPDGKTKKRKS